jgi:hypothetical protein
MEDKVAVPVVIKTKQQKCDYWKHSQFVVLDFTT